MNRKKLSKILTGVFIALFLAMALGVSWIATCGVVYLITLCFEWGFKWGVATGVWLILLFIVPLLKPNVTVKK